MSTPAPLQPSLFLERLIRLLLPYFLAGSTGRDAARAEILETLASYGARTRAELLNAAKIIAYGLTGLDALQHAREPDLSDSQRLRYLSCANGLDRAGQKNEQVLAKRLASDPPQPEEPPTEAEEAEFEDHLQQVHAQLAALGIEVPAPPIGIGPMARPLSHAGPPA